MSALTNAETHDSLAAQYDFAGFAGASVQSGPNTGIAAVGPGGPGPNTGIAAVGPGPRGSMTEAERREPNAAVPALSSFDELLALRK